MKVNLFVVLFFLPYESRDKHFCYLKYVLLLCYQLQILELVVEIDSLLDVKWFNKKQELFQKYFEMWTTILNIHSLFSFELIHTYRELNSLADALANLGTTGLYVWKKQDFLILDISFFTFL